MSEQLDGIVAGLELPEGQTESQAFRRELVILIKRDQFRQRLVGQARRTRGRTAA